MHGTDKTPALIDTDLLHTILIVEDDAQVRNAVVRIVLRLGYKVLYAESGEQALEIAQRYEDTIHLLLSDVILPGLSGPEAAQQILAARPDTRILYMSGHSRDELTPHLIALDSAAFIQKPFLIEQLSLALKELLY
jgi:two-component system cell cycle sensor histidine kinase/response regulator CckA